MSTLRTIVLIVLLLFIGATLKCAFGQPPYKYRLKQHKTTLILAFTAGMADGINQYVNYHYDGNNRFLQPDVSWRNKYKHGDPMQGEAFPGSTTIFVAFTDAHHLTRLIDRAAITGALVDRMVVSVKLGRDEWRHKKWWHYALEGISYWIVNRIGFNLTYELVKFK